MSTVTIETKKGGYLSFDGVTNVLRADAVTEITEVRGGKRNLHIIDNDSILRFSYYDVETPATK